MKLFNFITKFKNKPELRNKLSKETIKKFRKSKYYHPEIEKWKFTDDIQSCVPGGGPASWAFLGVTKEGKVLLKNTCGHRRFQLNERIWKDSENYCWNETLEQKEQLSRCLK